MLHIHNGDSTADTARVANIPGEHLVWREALICGPAPGNLSEKQFIEVRAKHLAKAYDIEPDKCIAELQTQHDVLKNLSSREEIVLWFEHDLFCQVQLIYLLNWLAQHDHRRTTLSLISINKFPGVEDFRGLGQLDAHQLASLFPDRRVITEKQLQLGTIAWQAYSSSDPRDVASLLTSDTSVLPFLRPAISKHLERFPSIKNGLGHVANVCLKLIASGQREFKPLFAEFGRHEPLYGFGDAQVFLELKDLANGKHPLIEFVNGNAAFEITDEGHAVLTGDKDSVKLNGIDAWLGGVHLQGETSEWRWDDTTQSLQSL